MPVARGEPEKGIKNEAPASLKASEDCSAEKVSNGKGGDMSLSGAKEDDDRYPSRTRLTFLTIGLMAVVLMVALDNYILDLLSHYFPLAYIVLIEIASNRHPQNISRFPQLECYGLVR